MTRLGVVKTGISGGNFQRQLESASLRGVRNLEVYLLDLEVVFFFAGATIRAMSTLTRAIRSCMGLLTFI